MIKDAIPYLLVFFAPLVLALILTPLVRELNRRLGMVDRPDARRINKTPIPRGGGIAVCVACFMGYFSVRMCFGAEKLSFSLPITMVALAVMLLGYADDRWSLKPRLKLVGQIVCAVSAWLFTDIGFDHLWPSLPPFVDCVMTVFWIVGAVNAFNLIDGLDGLASGLAFIAVLGMAGALVFLGRSPEIFFHLALAGALLGFLRYNYNPASVFLGDSGSMFIGFSVAILPLLHPDPNSFLVSVGVPLLAMGVPIFDTSLAILRRSIRRILGRGAANGSAQVMNADTDHLHHRILRSSGLSQRKAAWILYLMALFLVVTGLVAMNLESQRAGLWLAMLTVVVYVAFRDMRRVEFFDAGRLLGNLAHDHRLAVRRRYARLAVPFYIFFDLAAFIVIFVGLSLVVGRRLDRTQLLVALPVRLFATFVCLVVFRVYRTVWARAVLSNYLRLLIACVLGSAIGTVGCYYAPNVTVKQLVPQFFAFAALPLFAFLGVRVVRDVVRDLFYAFDCSRLIARKDVSRILVYGSGLRYRAFRRELVRTAAANTRIIVGLLDDDVLLRGHYIGGLQVLGTINEAPELIVKMNVDAVVVACQFPDEWRKVVIDILRPTGVKITFFSFNESEVQ